MTDTPYHELAARIEAAEEPPMKDEPVALKPCPMCGCDVELIDKENSGLWVFKCPDSSPCIGSWIATYAHGDHLPKAITRWNIRPADDLVRQLVEAVAKIAPIRTNDGPDYAEVTFSDGVKHSSQAMTMNLKDWQDIAAAYDALRAQGYGG